MALRLPSVDREFPDLLSNAPRVRSRSVSQDQPAPPVPPPLVNASTPAPVFSPGEIVLEFKALRQKLSAQQKRITELETRLFFGQDRNKVATVPRRNRAHVEGERISSSIKDVSLLSRQKRLIEESNTKLRRYISSHFVEERGLDFDLDKCLDNASRKLKKNKLQLKKIENKIATFKN